MYNRVGFGVNFLHSYQFELKFNRKPKQWSMTDIHNLYLRLEKRSNKRRDEFSEFIKKIINEVEPNDNDKYIVYFNVDDELYMYSIRKSLEFDWSMSTEKVRFSEDTSKGRDEKIDLILSKKNQFKLGEELHRLEKMKSHYLHHGIFNIITELVNDKLREKFKNIKNYNIPRIIKVDIGGTIYYVSLDNNSRGSIDWKNFEIIGKIEKDNEIIVI